MDDDKPTGIRVSRLRLAGLPGSNKVYEVDLRDELSQEWRPFSIIAGPSQTGKTSVADFILYCLGNDEHPQHPEILANVRSALLECELNDQDMVIERVVSGAASRFASLWDGGLDDLDPDMELRIPTEPPSEPDGLSQFVLDACGLAGVALPVSPSRPDTDVQTLSIQDLQRLFWLPNERLDSKNLTYEHSNFMVTQKFRQTIDTMFGVDDPSGVALAAQLRQVSESAREASQNAAALRGLVESEHPTGPLDLETQESALERLLSRLDAELAQADAGRMSQSHEVNSLRRSLEAARERARGAATRVRSRESLLERLSALRGQYADDRKKLTFLKEAERLFDPLNVEVCPACLQELKQVPRVQNGTCSLCGEDVAGLAAEAGNTNGHHATSAASDGLVSDNSRVLEAELKAVNRRLADLNDYWSRLDSDLEVLRVASGEADQSVSEAALSVDRAVNLPAPFLAARDDLMRRRSAVDVQLQAVKTGRRLWERVRAAETAADRLRGQASRLRAEQRVSRNRIDRANVISRLSVRFGEILRDIEYPKLSNPSIDGNLMPHVRGLPYTAASSGGLVLISLAWYLSLWEVSYEDPAAKSPGLLIIDSPQKNLGHAAHEDDPDFADTRLVQNFYKHAKAWLSGPGQGAQLIVIDNSPTESVEDDVVVRFTRNREVDPYGLIDDAID